MHIKKKQERQVRKASPQVQGNPGGAGKGQGRRLRARSALILSGGMLFATFSHAADKTVLIGLAAPMSGLSGSTGLSLQRAAEIAIRDLNVQNLRIGGDRIVFKLLPQDDRADPRAGELIADYFVKSKVAAVVGHWNSGVGIPASKIYNAAGIPQVAPAVTSHAYTQQGFATTFRIVGHDDDGARYTAEYVMRDLKARRIVIIDDRTPFGAGYAEQFDKAIGELKGNVAGHFSIGSKTSDFNEVLRQTKALDPDVIMFGGLDAQAGELVREIKRLEVPGRLVGIGGVVGQTFLKLAGTAGEGTTVLEPGLPSYKNAQWTHFQKSWK